MADLKTKYLGLELKNPVIIGASNLVTNIDNMKKAEEAGAAAIVFKSLFEEQIQLENAQMDDELEEYNDRHAEMTTLFPDLQHAGPEEHLLGVRQAKESVGIPVIASLNAIYKETWVEYAQMLEQTGVDALELNFYSVPRKFDIEGSAIENNQVEAVKAIKKKVKIPVSIKISPFYANPLNLISKFEGTGADGYVLFNRMFQPDINIDKEEHFTPFDLSQEDSHKLALRFAGLLYGNIQGSVCANSGIYTGEHVAKLLLAGADCVQVVSAVYRNKIEYVGTIVKELNNWMDKKGYKSIEDVKGKLSNKNINDPFVYKRAQYIDLLIKSGDVLKKYPLR
jgi:dihydroorotate dehydrogenase (fumarate)